MTDAANPLYPSVGRPPMRAWLPLLLALLAVVGDAAAVSLTEIASDGRVVRLYVDGPKGRMESSAAQGYMLVDDSADTLLMVMPDKNQAMDMSRFLKNTQAEPGPKTYFKPRGGGPTIAGYPTRRYDYRVGDQPCGTLFASKQALKDSGAEVLVQAMERVAAGRKALAMASTGPCDRGRGNIAKVVASLGLPMRIVDAGGRVDSEVRRVVVNAPPPAGGFGLPAGIRVRNISEEQAALAGKMGHLLQKMETSGKVSPQMQDMIRRARERYLDR